jgi:outer membrane protein OmpA-like peptidoglycan-associated protein
MDGPEEIKDDQERLALRIPEKKDNIFIYHPESERTIHLGSYGALDEVIAYLDRNPSKRVDIRAYTNSSGDKQRNLALTQKRVFEIRNYLILNGISAERISARGLGENNFPEINQTDRQDSQKLPVEMVIR